MLNNSEIWKDIEDYEGIYEISSLCKIRNKKTGKYLKFGFNKKNKYFVVVLYKNSQPKMHYVHRLVAKAFIPNPYNYKQVNHKNEDRQDNSLCNLEWCTNQYNNEYSHGKPISQFTLNNKFIRNWKSGREIRRNLGYDESVIGKVCRGKIFTAYGYKWAFTGERNVSNGV